MYQNHPNAPSIDGLPTMYDLPSEDLDDIDFIDPPSIDHLPTMYDLPSEDPEEPGLPSAEGVSLEVSSSACPARDEFHDFQPDLLRETFQVPAIEEYFIGVDLNLYYDTKQTRWYKRPDWFLVLGVPPSQSQQDLRLSYVVWQEGVAPFLMVELLSPGTEAEDLGQTLRVVGKPPTKWQVYEQILRVPYYAVFDRYSNQFRLFGLQFNQYMELTISGQGFWFNDLELGLGVWSGVYEDVEGQWLRWYERSGAWVPTKQERVALSEQRAENAEQRAGDAEQRAGDAEQRAERLAAKLRELGIEAD
jgi:Uma2 family endonuclease